MYVQYHPTILGLIENLTLCSMKCEKAYILLYFILQGEPTELMQGEHEPCMAHGSGSCKVSMSLHFRFNT